MSSSSRGIIGGGVGGRGIPLGSIGESSEVGVFKEEGEEVDELASLTIP